MIYVSAIYQYEISLEPIHRHLFKIRNVRLDITFWGQFEKHLFKLTNNPKATLQALHVPDLSASQTRLSSGSAMPIEIREPLDLPSKNFKARHVLRQSHDSISFICSAISVAVFNDCDALPSQPTAVNAPDVDPVRRVAQTSDQIVVGG